MPTGYRLDPNIQMKTEDGILYIYFTDQAEDTGGLFVPPPQKYAARFESAADKTIIRVRFWVEWCKFT